MYCVSFRLRAASSQSFRHDDIVLAFCAFWFYVVSSASDCVFKLSECCHLCNDKGAGRVCVCEQVVATAPGVNIRGYQNTTVARTRLNPCFFC